MEKKSQKAPYILEVRLYFSINHIQLDTKNDNFQLINVQLMTTLS